MLSPTQRSELLNNVQNNIDSINFSDGDGDIDSIYNGIPLQSLEGIQ